IVAFGFSDVMREDLERNHHQQRRRPFADLHAECQRARIIALPETQTPDVRRHALLILAQQLQAFAHRRLDVDEEQPVLRIDFEIGAMHKRFQFNALRRHAHRFAEFGLHLFDHANRRTKANRDKAWRRSEIVLPALPEALGAGDDVRNRVDAALQLRQRLLLLLCAEATAVARAVHANQHQRQDRGDIAFGDIPDALLAVHDVYGVIHRLRQRTGDFA
ncbi:hypothetical protein COLO4_02528, partial [Corchorus olitorius]